MRRISLVVLAIIAISYFHAAYGQEVKVDLTEIDTGMVIVSAANLHDGSASNGWSVARPSLRVVHAVWSRCNF